jgi:hypothetical protein
LALLYDLAAEMIRPLRAGLIAATLGAMLVAGVGGASAAQQPGGSCGSTSSAIDQYCENIPAANGRGTPPPGTPDTAPRLSTSPAAVHAIDRLPAKARKHAQKLLSLPAPIPVRASVTPSGGGWSLPLGVIIALIAVAATGAAAALARRRRGRLSE